MNLHKVLTSALIAAGLVVTAADAHAQAEFIRGDANMSGAIELGDVYQVINLFAGTHNLICEDAADYNDDGLTDLADVITTAQYLFVGGSPPTSPYPAPGVDPTDDALGCAVSLATGTPDPLVATTEAIVLQRFSFERVLESIVETSNDTVETTPTSFYQTWWNFWSTHCNDPFNGFEQSCNEAERALGDNDPFADPDGNPATQDNPHAYVPAALFNRFDLAPDDGSHCGEQRIVFGKVSGLSTLNDRNMLIFEARMPNPNPTDGRDGCAPIVQQWEAAAATSGAERADLLEQLFFVGLPSDNVPRVLDAAHFRAEAGQVRTNTRQSSQTWTLRQFQLNTACGGSMCVEYLFQRPLDHAADPSLFGPTETSRQASFKVDFLEWVPQLIDDPFTRLDVPWDYRAPSNPTVVEHDYTEITDDSFVAAIQATLDNIKEHDLTPTNVLDRANHQSCAGCHQLQANADLGGDVHAPSSFSFLHVNEHGDLSAGLLTRFLPERVTAVNEYLEGLD